MKFLDVPRSGSWQAITSSHNRFGQYVRNRATPVNPRSTAQVNQRANMAAAAQGWRALTDAQRAGWASLGSNISRTDGLGQTYTFNGFMAYCSINTNKVAAGDAAVSTAPTLVDPGSLVTVTVTLTAIAFSVAYTATPLAAGIRAFIFASPQKSAGRLFNADYRLIAVTAAAAASPANILTAYSARLGAPVAGNRIFLNIQLYQTGFLGSPFQVSQVVA